MLTGKRLRAAKERERLGLPPPPPPHPTTISWAQHENAMADLRIAHGQELAAVRKESGGAKVAALEAALSESEKRRAELEGLLAEATKPAPKADPPKGQGQRR